MKFRSGVVVMAVLTIVGVSACGDSGSDKRSKVIALTIAEAKHDGVALDKACVTAAVKAMPDSDIDKIADRETGDSIDFESLSDEGQTAAVKIFDCRPTSDSGLTGTQQLLFDEIKSSLSSSGATVDEDCLRDLVKGIDSEVLVNQDANALRAIGEQAAKCVS